MCDIACALADCVSVGLHSTYSSYSAYLAMKTADISLLLCAGDIVYRKHSDTVKNGGGVNGTTGTAEPRAVDENCEVRTQEVNEESSAQNSFWTVQEVLQLHEKSIAQEEMGRGDIASSRFLLGQVVVIDIAASDFFAHVNHMMESNCVTSSDKTIDPADASSPIVTSSYRDNEHKNEDREITGKKMRIPITFLVDVVKAVTADALKCLNCDSEVTSVPVDTLHSVKVDSNILISNACESWPEPPAPSLQADLEPLEEELCGRDRIFSLLFTSGSTGEPKAVVRNTEPEFMQCVPLRKLLSGK